MKPKILSDTLLNNRYLIKRVIGQGGFGRTYIASDTLFHDRPCVVKEFFPSVSNGEAMEKCRELFEREARTLQQLSHPQIPQFLDFFEQSEGLFIVQEYIDGQTYRDLLNNLKKENRVFQEAEITQWLKELLPVLDYIHSRSIIHRDISPDNIMFSKNGKVMLIDFGVVREVMTQVCSSFDGNSVSGSIVGKQGYSPPEQIRIGKCYPCSDLYALAVTALVLLTGREPNEIFDSLSMKWNWGQYITISGKLSQVFNKMLAEIPADRYQSASEILGEFNQNFTRKAVSTMIASPSESIYKSKKTKVNSVKTVVSNSNNTQKNLLKTIAVNPKTEEKSNKNKTITIIISSLVGILLLGGSFIAIKSPSISSICKILDNCAKDKEYQEKYDEAQENGIQSIETALEAQNITALEVSRNDLNTAISELKTIPSDVKVYDQGKETIKNYEQELEKIDDRLEKERKAEAQLGEINSLINESKRETEAATTINDFRQAKVKWQEIGEKLEKFPKDTLFNNEIQQQLNNSQIQIEEIDQKINQLVEIQRQQESARRKARREAIRRRVIRRESNREQSRRKTPPINNSPSYKPPSGPPLW